jgi:two-component system chemotaxis sensor kinase CheA
MNGSPTSPSSPAPTAPTASATPRRGGVRAKLIRAMIGTLAVVSALTLLIVGAINYRSARSTFETIETHLSQAIARKGQGLAANHALALRGLVADNAFGDVARLVERSVRGDEEMVYGLFLAEDGKPWAWVSPANKNAGPVDDSWKALGIDPATAKKKGATEATRRVFGQKVFEYSASVLSDEGGVLGRIYYGVSTATLSHALLSAREEFVRSLIVTLALLAALGLGGTFLGLGIIRGLSARITRPLGHLTEVATAIAGGRHNERVKVATDDELGVLGRAFNQMVEELNDSYQRLEGLNRTLESRVEERTRALAQRTNDMRLVLDNVVQGFLTMSSEGVLAQERSAIVDRWFGGYGPGVTFSDYFRKVDGEFADMFDLGLDALRESFLPFEVCIEQLPKRLSHDRREFSFTYLPINEADKLASLLVVVNDITDEVLLAQKEQERAELLAMMQTYWRDRTGAFVFFDEAQRIVQGLQASDLEEVVRKRLIHTLKGNAAVAGFEVVAGLCNTAEDMLAEQNDAGYAAIVQKLVKRWEVLCEVRANLMGERAADMVEVTNDRLDAFIHEMKTAGLPPALVNRVAAWRLEPAERSLNRLGSYAKPLAKRLDRGDIQIVVDGGGVGLDPRLWAGFWTEMVHVIRNAVDHGLEPADERPASKPAPRLTLRAMSTPAGVTIEVQDDGRGVDWDAVRRVAARKGLPTATHADLVHAIFAPDLSTRETATATSGRGVGLAAVWHKVEELRGQISVRSEAGVGTTFSFSFPPEVAGAAGDEAGRPAAGSLGTTRDRGPRATAPAQADAKP